MEVTLTEPQTEFYNSTAKATCAVAGFGSGKTDVAMFRMISSAIQYPTGDWLYAAPTIPLIRDILWAKLEQFLPRIGLAYSINKSESIVYLHGLGKIFCRSMDNPDRLVGFEVVDAFLDELDILPKDKALAVFRKIKARCRMKVPKDFRDLSQGWKLNQQWVTTTPEGFRATYELFKKNPAPNSHLVQMSTYSNAHNLPEDYIDDLKASYPAQLIDAYLLGKFVNLNALGVWPSYDPDLNHMSVDIVKGETIHFGQDFNVGRGCMVPYVFRTLPVGHPKNPTREQLRIMITVGEVVDSFDTPDSIRAANNFFPHSDYPNRIVYPDATGNFRKSVNASLSDLALMRHANFRVRVNNTNPSVKDRIIASNAAFCNSQGIRRVFVDTVKSPYFSEALVQQAYDLNGLPEKGKGKFDDMTDAGTYPINFHFPLRANKMFTTTVGGL